MRDLTAPLEAAFTAPHVDGFLAVSFGFDSGPLELWTGLGALAFGGKTFTGSGQLGRINRITETLANRRSVLTFALSGVDADILAIASGEHVEGRPGTLWLGALDPNGAVIPDPHVLRAFRIDTLRGRESGGKASIVLSTYSIWHTLNEPPNLFWDRETHLEEHPADKAFEDLPALLNRNIEVERRD